MTGQVPNPVFNKVFATCYKALLEAKKIPFELKNGFYPVAIRGDRYGEADKLYSEVHSLVFKHIEYEIDYDGSDPNFHP